MRANNLPASAATSSSLATDSLDSRAQQDEGPMSRALPSAGELIVCCPTPPTTAQTTVQLTSPQRLPHSAHNREVESSIRNLRSPAARSLEPDVYLRLGHRPSHPALLRRVWPNKLAPFAVVTEGDERRLPCAEITVVRVHPHGALTARVIRAGRSFLRVSRSKSSRRRPGGCWRTVALRTCRLGLALRDLPVG